MTEPSFLRGAQEKGPKLRRAQNKGSITLRGKFAPRNYGAWPGRVLDPLFYAPQSFGAVQRLPQALLETLFQGLK